MRISRRFQILLLLFCLPLAGRSLSQEATSPKVMILADPTVQDDQITVDILVTDSLQAPIPDLTTDNFSISEAAENLEVRAVTSRPIALAIVVNLSNGSAIDLIQQTLRAYFDHYYQPDDNIIFYILGTEAARDTARVEEPGDLAEIDALIDGFSRSDNVYSITNTLNASLNWLRMIGESHPNRMRQVLFVGSFLNRSNEDNASQIFADERIPFHVVQAHQERATQTEVFRTLAETGGGLFVNNAGGRLIASSDDSTPVGGLKTLFDRIATGRVFYTLSYQSTSQELDTNPTITVAVSVPGEQTVEAQFSYERVFLPPSVEIVAPTNLNPIRKPILATDELRFDVAEEPISIRVEFPDGVARAINSLNLEVVDRATGELIQSLQQSSPDIDEEGELIVAWSLFDFATPETTTPVQLVVTITDELNLTDSATVDGSVEVVALPPAPTPPPTTTPEPSPSPQPAATQVTGIAALINQVEQPSILILVGVIVLLMILVLLLLLMLRRAETRNLYDSDEYATDPGLDAVQGVDSSIELEGPDTDLPEEQPLFGRLIAISGLQDREILIDRNEFIIGRTLESGCDYVIPEPFISPKHCMLLFHDGNLTIKDLGSKNGTFVNGERLPREREVIVPFGSEIGVTRSVIFELYDPAADIVLEEIIRSSEHGDTAHGAGGDEGELVFRPLPGINYADDEGAEIDDDYSPL